VVNDVITFIVFHCLDAVG